MEREMPKTQRFEVIEGGGQRPSRWQNPPATVIGLSPFDRKRVQTFRVAALDARKAVMAGRRTPLFELWWNVLGRLPPVSGHERFANIAATANGIGIHSAHACFRGIMRPVAHDDRGWDFVAFVTKPQTRICYTPSMSCVIEPKDVPHDLVHLAYVKLDFPDGRSYNSEDRNAAPYNGIV